MTGAGLPAGCAGQRPGNTGKSDSRFYEHKLIQDLQGSGVGLLKNSTGDVSWKELLASLLAGWDSTGIVQYETVVVLVNSFLETADKSSNGLKFFRGN